MEDVSRISQETADELNMRLANLCDTIQVEQDLFDRVVDSACVTMMDTSAKRIYHCLVRHTESCWLTKWYWMRRLRKELDNQDRVMECCRELRKLKYGHETE